MVSFLICFFYESYLMLINVRIVKWKLFYYFLNIYIFIYLLLKLSEFKYIYVYIC